jgi:Holliday junction resolvase RusA-like endonuclease
VRLTIEVKGRPAPQGSHDLGSAGQFLDASPYLKAWRAAVKIAAWRACSLGGVAPVMLPVWPKGKPVVIELCTFYLDTEPTAKPDIDKLLRSTFDALGGARDMARLFVDDSQIVEVHHVAKLRARGAGNRAPGAKIIIADKGEK